PGPACHCRCRSSAAPMRRQRRSGSAGATSRRRAGTNCIRPPCRPQDMCGRFVQKTPLGAIQVLFETVNPVPNAPVRYNAAPTDTLAVVRYNPKTNQRSLDLLRWGLVPLWAKDPSFGPKCIIARSETVATNKIFRDAFERRRCLVPADGFYEWQKRDGATQPFAIVPQEGAVFAFAGL